MDINNRYSKIEEKDKREIVLLRGNGCKWKKCLFCDYHLDYSKDEESNFLLNKEVLQMVSGEYGKLEVINSGSFVDLNRETMLEIKKIMIDKNIKEVYFESHYQDKNDIVSLKEFFDQDGIKVKLKLGLETLNYDIREKYFNKGIVDHDLSVISKDFDFACLLVGFYRQDIKMIEHDINESLKYFERICINVFTNNKTVVKADEDLIKSFVEKIYPQIKDDDRVDILLNNLDFGVGE